MSAGIDSTSILEELIPAVPDGVPEKVRSIGFERVCGALVDELVHRCAPPSMGGSIEIHVRISSPDGESADYTVSFADESVTAERGVPESAFSRVEFTVVNLANCLFGRQGPVPTAGWRHVGLQVPTPDTPPEEIRELLKVQEGGNRANTALLAACGPRRPSLEDLACRFGTDKWGTVHWYTPHYEHHFARFADERVRVLEIGIGGYHDPRSGGGSLRMWQQFFRRGTVFGLDVYEKTVDVPRVHTLRGDQGNAEYLSDMAEEHGPFDIIVDDGSHLNEHVLTSFNALFPHLKDGGVYAIEDMETSYWPAWGGDAPDRATSATSIGFVKTLIDGLNHREFDGADPSYLDENIVSVHFYKSLAFIVKGANTECAAPVAVRDMSPTVE